MEKSETVRRLGRSWGKVRGIKRELEARERKKEGENGKERKRKIETRECMTGDADLRRSSGPVVISQNLADNPVYGGKAERVR